MRVKNRLATGSVRLGKFNQELTKEAKQRLKWFDYYYTHDCNARLTCRHFDISPQTFYRWKKRYDPKHLVNMESHSHRPKHLRQPTYSAELVESVRKLREQYPRWGKDKLTELLHEQGYQVSGSTVGRILQRLKERGVLVEPMRTYVSATKRHRARPYAQRKPKEYKAAQAGDLVELDTLDIRPLPGVILKHFTAHDVISRWNVIGVYSRSTAANAALFLDKLQERMPFAIRAIQVDGGSEFEAAFETECERRGLQLFVLPPRSPKLNGGVERAHRTHVEEFYEITNSCFEVAELTSELLEWERIYNTVRPHQALGYLTPLRFIKQCVTSDKKEGQVSPII
jgi:putative transposase